MASAHVTPSTGEPSPGTRHCDEAALDHLQRERLMRRFKSAEQAQRFLEPFGAVGDHFRTGRYRTQANTRRQLLAERRRTWREVVGLAPVV